ncbi:hypothetical protein SARC_00952 [Sphaeroforma arctica JP610]|uniref:Methyltransferase domain-containing protein n=1 Tax=Sphaeroforma arctica JP610 TaxID=667725 RepID=A0A0L0GD14_9EUKA|nr:hypothetical protein SARC_00952 [Sphaeroforma arctica JP610]KNC86907.1 hypothetical protein SARC_00952 [Sphaeroforma arctica JP610]|eukprot:XP_014160809.1 hypothetical protein SARC_00952 [Sphaeroforma arctica JP610]
MERKGGESYCKLDYLLQNIRRANANAVPNEESSSPGDVGAICSQVNGGLSDDVLASYRNPYLIDFEQKTEIISALRNAPGFRSVRNWKGLKKEITVTFSVLRWLSFLVGKLRAIQQTQSSPDHTSSQTAPADTTTTHGKSNGICTRHEPTLAGEARQQTHATDDDTLPNRQDTDTDRAAATATGQTQTMSAQTIDITTVDVCAESPVGCPTGEVRQTDTVHECTYANVPDEGQRNRPDTTALCEANRPHETPERSVDTDSNTHTHTKATTADTDSTTHTHTKATIADTDSTTPTHTKVTTADTDSITHTHTKATTADTDSTTHKHTKATTASEGDRATVRTEGTDSATQHDLSKHEMLRTEERERLATQVGRHPEDGQGWVIFDMCSGKGFTSLMLAMKYPKALVVMIDKNFHRMKLQYLDEYPNVSQETMNILSPQFAADFEQVMVKYGMRANDVLQTGGETTCTANPHGRMGILIGLHTCGVLAETVVGVWERFKAGNGTVHSPNGSSTSGGLHGRTTDYAAAHVQAREGDAQTPPTTHRQATAAATGDRASTWGMSHPTRGGAPTHGHAQAVEGGGLRLHVLMLLPCCLPRGDKQIARDAREAGLCVHSAWEDSLLQRIGSGGVSEKGVATDEHMLSERNTLLYGLQTMIE